jgi:hypothetical protein
MSAPNDDRESTVSQIEARNEQAPHPSRAQMEPVLEDLGPESKEDLESVKGGRVLQA